MLDYFSDAMSWDPINGISNPNCIIEKKNTNSKYNIIINDNENNILNFSSSKTKIKKKVLKEFSIEPNYICYFKNYNTGYKLLFNEKQIDKKVILLNNIKIQHNIYNKYLKYQEHSFLYPQEMNFKVLF